MLSHKPRNLSLRLTVSRASGPTTSVSGNVEIETNPQTRESRLFGSIPEYLRRNGSVILRAYNMYWPVQTFGLIAALLLLVGLSLGGRFLFFYIQDPDYSGHIQSLLVGVGAVVMAFLVGLMALLGDLMASNRRLTEEVLARVRRLDAKLAEDGTGVEGVDSTGVEPWRPSTWHQNLSIL